MAKKSTKVEITEERKALLQRIADRIVKKIIAIDRPWTVDGMHTLPHKTKEKGFRQYPIDPSQEFLISGAYVGARGQLIFKFEPVDAQEYEHIEVDEKIMDEVFPLLGPEYAMAIGVDGEDFKLMILATEQQLTAEDKAKAEAELAAKEAADQEYTTNPLFGRF